VSVLLLLFFVCVRTAGRVVDSLPEGGVVVGITSFGEGIYVLRWKGRGEIEVYDVDTCQLQRCLAVPFSRCYTDMTSCGLYRCIYISDAIAESLHKVDLQGQAVTWAIGDEPGGLSVNRAHNVLVTCLRIPRIQEFGSNGDLMREIMLVDTAINPWHAIQLTSGEFVLSHGEAEDPIRRVCKLSSDGGHIIHSHDGAEEGGSRPDTADRYYRIPRHLAVNSNEFVFVADIPSRRVTLLSPSLRYLRDVVTLQQLKWFPYRMFLDVRRRRLYVTDNEFENGRYKSGRVVVFSI